MDYKEYMSMIGKKGAAARLKKYSKEELSAFSRKGARRLTKEQRRKKALKGAKTRAKKFSTTS